MFRLAPDGEECAMVKRLINSGTGDDALNHCQDPCVWHPCRPLELELELGVAPVPPNSSTRAAQAFPPDGSTAPLRLASFVSPPTFVCPRS